MRLSYFLQKKNMLYYHQGRFFHYFLLDMILLILPLTQPNHRVTSFVTLFAYAYHYILKIHGLTFKHISQHCSVFFSQGYYLFKYRWKVLLFVLIHQKKNILCKNTKFNINRWFIYINVQFLVFPLLLICSNISYHIISIVSYHVYIIINNLEK